MLNSLRKVVTVISCQVVMSSIVYAAQYLPLPDGSYLEIPEGVGIPEAAARAKELYPEAFKIKTIPVNEKFDSDYLQKCLASVAKDSKTESGVQLGIRSCEERAVPKKCRPFDVKMDRFGNESGADRVRCVKACAQSSAMSRTFGDCSPG